VWGEVMGEGTLGPHPTPFFLLSYRAIKGKILIRLEGYSTPYLPSYAFLRL